MKHLIERKKKKRKDWLSYTDRLTSQPCLLHSLSLRWSIVFAPYSLAATAAVLCLLFFLIFNALHFMFLLLFHFMLHCVMYFAVGSKLGKGILLCPCTIMKIEFVNINVNCRLRCIITRRLFHNWICWY